MVNNIKAKSTDAVIWSTIDRFGQQGIQFITGIVVARLLFPSDYGLIGMLSLFLAIPDVLISSGFGAALIQKQSADETDFSTVFYFNIVTALVLYLILYISAPLIAAFFEQPQLVLLTRVLGLTIIISSFTIIQRTILTKNLDLKTQTKISISSILPSGILGVAFAYYGYGVWAIVFQSLSRRFLTSLFFWLFTKWRPKLIFSMQSLKSLFTFASNILFAGLLNTAFTRVYTIVIGKVFSAASLGFYTRADQLRTLPVSIVGSVIERVSFPIFSSLQDDNQLLLKGYRKTVKMAAFIIFPIMLGLIVISEPFVRLLLTERWLPSVPFLRIMCVSGLTMPLQSLALSVIMAKGHSGLFLKLDIVKKVLIVLTIYITYRWGVMAILYGNAVLAYIFYYLNFYYTGKKLNFSFGRQLLDLLPYFLTALLMAVLMFISGYFITNSDVLILVVQVFTGIIAYTLLSKLFKFEAYHEAILVLIRVKSKFIDRK